MFNSQTSNWQNGMTNAGPGQAMATSGIPDPTWAHVFHDEFNTLSATAITTTTVGTGTTALVAESGGVLLDTTSAAAGDALYHQVPVAGFQITAGAQLFFKCRLKLDSATLSDVYAGLIETSATPLAPQNGLFFVKPAGAASLLLRHIKAGVVTDTPIPVASQVLANTWVELSFYCDGGGNVAAFVNPTTGLGRPVPGGSRGMVAKLLALAGGWTAAMLSPSFGIRNSTAAARTLRCDYLTVVNELQR